MNVPKDPNRLVIPSTARRFIHALGSNVESVNVSKDGTVNVVVDKPLGLKQLNKMLKDHKARPQ